MSRSHISSLLIRCRPELRDTVGECIAGMRFAEVAINDPSGKIVVTLETPSEAEVAEAMTRIQLLDGVASAALVFHQTDDLSDIEGAVP